MTAHPIQLVVKRAARIPRLHLVIRLALLLAIGMLGLSSLYWVIYVSVPALVALRIVQTDGVRYRTNDGPRVRSGLRWIAGAYAYLWLLTNDPPTAEPGPTDVLFECEGQAAVASCLLRLIYSLPAVLLVVVLTCAAALVWLITAAFVLATEQVPGALADFLELVLRVQIRFFAYHLSLVDRYPSLEASRVDAVNEG